MRSSSADAPGERREAGRDLQALARADALDAVEADRSRDTAQLRLAQGAQLEVALHQLVGRIADHDPVRRSERLQPRGLVGRRAHHLAGVEHDDARVDGDPDLQPERVLADRADDLQAAEHGAARVVLVRVRKPEAHEQAVALAVFDEAAVSRDDLGAPQPVVAQDRARLLGVAPVGERRGADEVAAQERQPQSLVGALEQRLGPRVAGVELEDRPREAVRVGALARRHRAACVREQALDVPRDPVGRHRGRGQPLEGGVGSTMTSSRARTCGCESRQRTTPV